MIKLLNHLLLNMPLPWSIATPMCLTGKLFNTSRQFVSLTYKCGTIQFIGKLSARVESHSIDLGDLTLLFVSLSSISGLSFQISIVNLNATKTKCCLNASWDMKVLSCGSILNGCQSIILKVRGVFIQGGLNMTSLMAEMRNTRPASAMAKASSHAWLVNQ